MFQKKKNMRIKFLLNLSLLFVLAVSSVSFSGCSTDEDNESDKTNVEPTNEDSKNGDSTNVNPTNVDPTNVDPMIVASTNPYERIIGSWKLIKVNDEDKASQNIVMTFNADGTWTVSNPTIVSTTESDSQDIGAQVVSFEDGWVYNADSDVISGYLDLQSPSVFYFPYRFELKGKELMLSFEPRDVRYIMAPTPSVRYYVRN